METALLELKDKYDPDRIIIECSGSAFPATLAFQIRKLEVETSGKLKLDGIITVIDAENFLGYEDTSPTAKMQASFTDLILINKWEHVSDRALDIVLDHLNTLNDSTPKVRCCEQGGVDPNIIFGLESTLCPESNDAGDFHHDEVETITIHHDMPGHAGLTKAVLERAFGYLSKDVVWRVKGFVRIIEGTTGQESVHIVNWAFGRYDLLRTELPGKELIRLSVMGERGEVKRAVRQFVEVINGT